MNTLPGWRSRGPSTFECYNGSALIQDAAQGRCEPQSSTEALPAGSLATGRPWRRHGSQPWLNTAAARGEGRRHRDKKLLLAHGANPSLPTAAGVTPLMAAAGNGSSNLGHPRTVQNRGTGGGCS